MPQSKILVIEDEASIRTAVHTILSRSGYEVEVSPYLATAIGQALSGDYDLITLDLSMPGIDGRDISELFQNQKLKTPVLVISAYLDPSIENQLKAMEVQHFLSKPFKIPELLEAVEKALAE